MVLGISILLLLCSLLWSLSSPGQLCGLIRKEYAYTHTGIHIHFCIYTHWNPLAQDTSNSNQYHGAHSIFSLSTFITPFPWFSFLSVYASSINTSVCSQAPIPYAGPSFLKKTLILPVLCHPAPHTGSPTRVSSLHRFFPHLGTSHPLWGQLLHSKLFSASLQTTLLTWLGPWCPTLGCLQAGALPSRPTLYSAPSLTVHTWPPLHVVIFGGSVHGSFPLPWLRTSQRASGQTQCVLFWEWIVTSSLSPFGSGFLSCDCFLTFPLHWGNAV